MQTTTETLSVNGTVLNTLAKNITSLTGRLRAPAHRTDNIAVPGMHGELWVPNKKFGANTITLPMWVQGCDDDGAIPQGSSKRREFFARVDELVGLFKGTKELLDVRWTLPDGSVRQCWAEATDVFDFTTDSEAKAAVGVVLTVPGAFWQDVNEISQTFAGAGASVKPTKFAGGSAPIDDMIYEFTGPWDGPGIHFQDGSWFLYSDTIPAGQGLTIDCGEWELTGTGGFVPNYSKLTHDGEDSSWGSLPAMPAAAPSITLDGTGRTGASQVVFRGRRKYLIG